MLQQRVCWQYRLVGACPTLNIPANATVNTSLTLLDIIVAERCEDGFMFLDSDEDVIHLTCLGNKTWNSEPRICIR